jgi:hypothetical protein
MISTFEAGISGFADLTIHFTDGLNANSYTIVDVEVMSSPIAGFTVPFLSFCNNENEIDLNEFVLLTGGVFNFNDGAMIEDGILNLSDYTFGSLPDTVFIDYYYQSSNGCYAYDYVDVEILPAPEIDIISIIPTSCGNSAGSISAIITSPSGNYASYWSNGTHNSSQITGLEAGAYYLNVIDDNGCFTMAQGVVEMTDIIVTGITTPVSCHNGTDGKIELSITGAGAPFSILWSSGQSTLLLEDRMPGNYDAVITDVNGCQTTASFSLANPAKLNIEFYQISPSSCTSNDGMVEAISVQNAVGSVNYLWSNGSTGAMLTGLSNGVYSVMAIDDNGCTLGSQFTLNSFSAPYLTSEVVTKATCNENDGSIELTIQPSFGETVTGIMWSNNQTTPSIYGLSPGYYSCVITQSDGCESHFGWNIQAKAPERPEICLVTVDSLTTSNLVVWEKPLASAIDYYTIYRETSSPGQFLPIHIQENDLISVFNDVVASPKVHSWRYKISATNECGVESIRSKTHKTIYLTYQEQATGEYRVAWDNYEGFIYSEYDLLRYTDTEGWEVVAPGINIMQLPEFIDNNVPAHTVIDYMVEITPPNGICTATVTKAQDYNSSRSNKARGEFNPGDGTGDPNNSLVEFESENFSVAIYPNPTNGMFTMHLEFTHSVGQNMEVDIYDVRGNRIINTSIHEGNTQFDLQHISAGMYLVYLRVDKEAKVVKIIKE